MADYNASYTYVIRDCNGNNATMPLRARFADADTLATFAVNSATVSATMDPPGTISNGKVVERGLAVEIEQASGALNSTNPPLESWFSHVEDKALLSFANSHGYKRNLYVPAPIEAVFAAPPSDMSVNAAQTAVAGLITAIAALITDPAGNVLNNFKGGAYVGRGRHVNEA